MGHATYRILAIGRQELKYISKTHRFNLRLTMLGVRITLVNLIMYCLSPRAGYYGLLGAVRASFVCFTYLGLCLVPICTLLTRRDS